MDASLYQWYNKQTDNIPDREEMEYMENFETKLTEFMARIQEMMNKNISINPPTIQAERGQRYIRIVRHGPAEHSVYCFVEMATGDILKPAGYKTPAKHARGNILDEHGGMSWLTPYGVGSLR